MQRGTHILWYVISKPINLSWVEVSWVERQRKFPNPANGRRPNWLGVLWPGKGYLPLPIFHTITLAAARIRKTASWLQVQTDGDLAPSCSQRQLWQTEWNWGQYLTGDLSHSTDHHDRHSSAKPEHATSAMVPLKPRVLKIISTRPEGRHWIARQRKFPNPAKRKRRKLTGVLHRDVVRTFVAGKSHLPLPPHHFVGLV